MNKKNLKILAVDDVNDNLISLKALISEAFPESVVVTALNGKAGILLAIKENPDVILLDIVMPDMDGFEVCRKLKADSRLCDTPVVFLTALKDDREIRIRALESGAEAFLAKPIDPIELTAQIRAMVKIKTANLDKIDEKERLKELVSLRTSELERELSEHRQTALRLQETRDKHQTLVEQASDGIFIADSDGNYVDVNAAGCAIVGYTSGEILKLNLRDLIAPEDSAQVPLKLELLRKGKTIISEREMIRKDGTAVPVEISGKMLADGRFQGIVRDITERRKAERALQESNELFSLFMVHSPIYAYIKEVSSTESRVLKASENFIEMTGISGTDMMGKTMGELFPAEFAAKISADDWEVVTSGKVLTLEEDLNGHNYVTLKFPIYQGGRHLLAGYTIDITKRKQAEETINEKAKELERFNNLMIGRELKMIELKEEVNHLLEKLGEKNKYTIQK